MMTIDVGSNDLSASAYDSLNNSQSPVIRAATLATGVGGEEGSPPVGEMAQHMLRNILQGVGHQSDLFNGDQQNELKVPHCENDTNHIINNNNNNNNNNNINNNNNNNNNELKVINLSTESCRHERGGVKADFDDSAMDMDTDQSEVSPRFQRVEQAEIKRARVENIVSSMRTTSTTSNSSSAVLVNGCKKRKLYQPQQHDNTMNVNDSTEIASDVEEDLATSEGEKNDLKNQLQTMKQQLAEMQQKYVQLYTKKEDLEMESSADSDIDQESSSIPSPKEPSQSPSQPSTPPRKLSKPTSPVSSFPPLLPLSFLQPHHHPLSHPALSNAAAMYLGMSQKIFLEQEARMAKETAMELTKREPRHRDRSPSPRIQSPLKKHIPPSPRTKTEFSDHLQMLNLNPNGEAFDPEGLAAALKSEIKASMSSLMTLIDRFVHTKKLTGRTAEAMVVEQINKDLMVASQLLDRKSPRTKVIDRGNCGDKNANYTTNVCSSKSFSSQVKNYSTSNPENNINVLNLPASRPLLPSKLHSNAAANLFCSNQHLNPFSLPDIRDANIPEQNEALSLVVAPKKKRHKVTDTRVTPRTVSRMLAQDNFTTTSNPSDSPSKYGNSNGSPESSPPMRAFHLQNSSSTLPVSLPTNVAIPNPSLHESQVFSPYSPFYGHHLQSHQLQSTSPASLAEHLRDSPPLHHFHPALLAAVQQQQQHQQRIHSPTDYMRSISATAADDAVSECTSTEYDGLVNIGTSLNANCQLNAKHLRKAKMMFFYVRYPTSQLLKTFFPDVQFNKNNTAQLVKWFSNFREYYYGQIEREAQNMIKDGRTLENLKVTTDGELYRNLNGHYNRNNQLEVPENFCYVVEQTLREFYKAIVSERNREQSWKKAIYKIIAKLDDPVPEYFKIPNFIDQLE